MWYFRNGGEVKRAVKVKSKETAIIGKSYRVYSQSALYALDVKSAEQRVKSRAKKV